MKLCEHCGFDQDDNRHSMGFCRNRVSALFKAERQQKECEATGAALMIGELQEHIATLEAANREQVKQVKTASEKKNPPYAELALRYVAARDLAKQYKSRLDTLRATPAGSPEVINALFESYWTICKRTTHLQDHHALCNKLRDDILVLFRNRRTALADDPSTDCTDLAHPAWWRGERAATLLAVSRITAILDGTDDGSGVYGSPEFEKLRRRLLSKGLA